MRIITFVFILFFSLNTQAIEEENYRKPLNIENSEKTDTDYYKESDNDEYRDFKLEVEIDEENSFNDFDRRPSNEEPELKPWAYSPDDDQLPE